MVTTPGNFGVTMFPSREAILGSLVEKIIGNEDVVLALSWKGGYYIPLLQVR